MNATTKTTVVITVAANTAEFDTAVADVVVASTAVVNACISNAHRSAYMCTDREARARSRPRCLGLTNEAEAKTSATW